MRDEEQVCLGASSYREIKKRPVWPVVKSWLSGPQLSKARRVSALATRNQLPVPGNLNRVLTSTDAAGQTTVYSYAR